MEEKFHAVFDLQDDLYESLSVSCKIGIRFIVLRYFVDHCKESSS